jgi:fatty acid elongase 3
MFVVGIMGSIEIYNKLGWVGLYITKPHQLDGIFHWALYVFYLSKFYELIDTMILALKKKTIIFLHWYHHAIVVLSVWSWMEARFAVCMFAMLLNTFVHIWMYWYYFATSLGWKVWYKVSVVN